MSRRRHRFLRGAGFFLFLLIVFLVFLQTPWGKGIVAGSIARALNHPGELEVEIGRISGWIPAQVMIDQVEVSDASGKWLSIRGLQGRWLLLQLFRREVHLGRLHADEVSLLRLPSMKSGASGSSDGFGMTVRLEQFSVDHLLLDRGLAGMPLEYSVHSGNMSLANGVLSGVFSIDGDAVGRVTLHSEPDPGRTPQLALLAELDKLNKPSFGMDHVSVRLDLLRNADGINATLNTHFARNGVAGDLSAGLVYTGGLLEIKDGRFEGGGYTANGDISLGFDEKQIFVEIDLSATDAQKMPYTLSGRGGVDRSGASWLVYAEQLEVVVLDVVRMTMSGQMTPEQMDVDLRLDEFEVERIPLKWAAPFVGRAGGNVSLKGAPAAPVLAGRINVSRFGPSARTLNELPKLDGHVSIRVEDGTLSASTSIENFTPGYLSASAVMPCALSILPFQCSVDPAMGGGVLDSVLDLEVCNGLAILNNQRISGIFSSELIWTNGVPDGSVNVEKGSYENYSTGIAFTELQAVLDILPDGFSVEQATASDGVGGSVRLSGGMKDKTLDLQLDLSHAGLVRRPDAEATLSGRLAIAGDWARPVVSGNLQVDRADLLPDNMMAAKPVLLEGYDADAERNVSRSKKAVRSIPVGLDVTVELLDQVYVSASLIDSVWGGTLHFQDTPEGLAIKGRMVPRRGYVDFIGKKFRFTDGSVDLEGTAGGRPVLNNLTAEFERSDITARLVLNGSVSNPQFQLDSTPALPDDEILSQVLFKRDAGTISPYQAIQIATAARQLTDGLSGPGFIYQFRHAIGMDTFEIREAANEGDGSSVAAGKYLTPELYIEVSSSFGSEAQTDMTIEYEIDRHFSVETSAGPSLRPGIGLNWKTDY